MIDPLRLVSTDAGIDDCFPIVEPEIVHPWIVQVLRDARPENAAPGVFDNELAFPERFRGKNTATVHARSLYHDAKHAPSVRGASRTGIVLAVGSGFFRSWHKEEGKI